MALELEKLHDKVIELQVSSARAEEQIKAIGEKVDDIAVDIKEIKTNIVNDVKVSNSQLKKWVTRSMFFLLGSGSIAGGISALAQILK